jgi:transcription factor MYB, plant
MSRPQEEDPLTLLSLSLPGTDQRSHHHRARSHFQELPASPPSPCLPHPPPPAAPPEPSGYQFNPESMVAMQGLWMTTRGEVCVRVWGWGRSGRRAQR